MDPRSPVDDSMPDLSVWECIVTMAGRIDRDRSSGQPIDADLALQLARAIVLLDDSRRPTEGGPTTGTWRTK